MKKGSVELGADEKEGESESKIMNQIFGHQQHPKNKVRYLENIFFSDFRTLVAGAWTERKKMYHGGSFLKLADDNMDIQNPEAQNREISGF